MPGTDSHPYLSVLRQATEQKDVREIIKSLKADLVAKYPDFKVIAEAELTVGASAGRQIIYTRSGQGQPYQFVQAFVVIEENTYIFTAVCWPQAYVAFKPTITSFFESFATIKKSN